MPGVESLPRLVYFNSRTRYNGAMKKKPLRAVFVGFGNVAQKNGGHADRGAATISRIGRTCSLEPVAIFTRQRGALVDPAGIDLERALKQFRDNGAFPAAPMPVMQALETLDYDVLVELSTLNIAEKGEPAISHVRAALKPQTPRGHRQQGAGGFRLPGT